MLHPFLSPAGLIFLGVLLSAAGAFWASQQQAAAERSLREKSEEVARLSKEVTQLVTGGDSFCHMEVGNLDHTKNQGICSFVHEGKYPLYAATARFVDPRAVTGVKDVTAENYPALIGPLYEIGDLPGGAKVGGPFSLGDFDKKDIDIFYSARNGFFSQQLRFRKVNGKWCSASRVLRDKQTIFERVGDSFPRNPSGRVEWE